ncbi:acyl-CoA thioesterase [Nocardioides antri]|nr:thioesterase family protein [Nocardioides antri]
MAVSTNSEPATSASLLVEEEWLAWPGMHGGRVMALSAGVATGLVDGLPLRAMSTRFLGAVRPGPVEAAAVLDHASRSSATVTVSLSQDGRITTLSTCSFTASTGEIVVPARPAPEVPPAEECNDFREAELLYPFARKLDIRPATDILPLSGASRAELTAWLRLREPESPLSTMLTLADAMPPGVYAVLDMPVPVPSLEISVHLHRPPTTETLLTGWTLAQQRNVQTGAGISIDECDMWDEDGRLVAQSRQLRRVLENGSLT